MLAAGLAARRAADETLAPIARPSAPPVEDVEPPPSEELRARTGFPRPPRGTSPNCGPEHRFTTRPIDSPATFAKALRTELYVGEDPGATKKGEPPARGAKKPSKRSAKKPADPELEQPTWMQWISLHEFQDPRPRMGPTLRPVGGGPVDWAAVEKAVTVTEEGGVTYYRLVFTPMTCSGYTLTMTSTGAGSFYGCCGA